jgi:transcriptional regulator with XRE-family HTH domain
MGRSMSDKHIKPLKELRRDAGKYIKKIREDKNLSQLDLSKALGYDYYSFISQIENGTSRVPPEGMRDWARNLGVPYNMFAKTLLRFYEPYFFEAMFTDETQS